MEWSAQSPRSHLQQSADVVRHPGAPVLVRLGNLGGVHLEKITDQQVFTLNKRSK